MPSDSAGGNYPLLPHPTSQCGAVSEISVAVARPSFERLTLEFRLAGELDMLRIPEPRPPVRSDGLWRHCCFEAFIGHGSASDYWEYNFSPSGAWAAYHFTAYREAMAPLMKGGAPDIAQKFGSDAIELSVVIDIAWLARSPAGARLRLGAAAVIEDKARVLSYWALKHPAEKPDFHHAEGFVVALD